MTSVAAGSFLLRAFARAPADRVDGRRGPRGALAVFATLAALAALVARGGANSSGGRLDWKLDGPEWVDPLLVAAAVGLGVVAMLLWAARRAWVVAIALVALPCIFGGAVLAVVIKHRSGRISVADFRAVADVYTKTGIRDRLGAPAGHGTRTSSEGRFDCLLYARDLPDPDAFPGRFFFCFNDQRVVWRGTQ